MSASAPPPSPLSPIARKLEAFVRLDALELERLQRLQDRRRRFTARSELVHEDQAGARAYILQDGRAFSHKLLADGNRQVVDFQIRRFPGPAQPPVAHLRSLGRRGHRPRRLGDRPGGAARHARGHAPARHGDAVGGVARRGDGGRAPGRNRPAQPAGAHRTLLRRAEPTLALVELGAETGFGCPLNQYLLADALGLSAIHLNRTLRALRERGLLALRSGVATVHDPKGLAELAGFEAGYLDQGHPPS